MGGGGILNRIVDPAGVGNAALNAVPPPSSQNLQNFDELLRRFNAMPPESTRRYLMPRTEEEYKNPPRGTGSGPRNPEGEIGYMDIVPQVPEDYPPTSPSMGAARPGSGVYRTERPETTYLRPVPPGPQRGPLNVVEEMRARVNTGIHPPLAARGDTLGTLFWWLPQLQQQLQPQPQQPFQF
jgi:hypothetical protein